MSKRMNTRRLNVESMESRQLMAGNVFVSVVGGDLVVTGDAAANGVEIRQLGVGKYDIIGTDQGGASTKIWLGGVSAGSQVVAGVTDDFNIALGAGDDFLRMSNAYLPIGARMQVPDQLLLRTDDGNDTCYLTGVQVRDDAWINLGNQNDYMEMNYDVVGGSPVSPDNDLLIFGGAGADQVKIYNSHVRDDVLMSLGDGNDYAYLSSFTVGDDASIYGSTGNDQVILWKTSIRDELVIDTGDGNDTCFLSSVAADGIYAQMGLGDQDHLLVVNTKANHARFDGGPGAIDNLDLLAGNVFGGLLVSNFEL